MQDAVYLPHTAGRYQVKRFRKAQVRARNRRGVCACDGRRVGGAACAPLPCPVLLRMLAGVLWCVRALAAGRARRELPATGTSRCRPDAVCAAAPHRRSARSLSAWLTP